MRNALFIGCGKSHPAALFVLAICLGAAGTSPAQETNPPEKVREIFVPFKDLNILLENQPRRVLLSRQQYDELLKKARIAPARHVPQAAVLMAADYSGRSDGQRVRITGTLAIDVLEKGLQAVPLDLGGVGLLSAKLDDRDAPIGRAPDGALRLLVEGIGRHALVLEMVAPLETTAARQLLFLRLPRAAAGRLTLVVPGDVEIRSGLDVAGRTLDRAAGVTRFELLPAAGDATLVMSLNSHLQRREQAVIARSVLVDEVTAACEKLYATVSLAILYRAVDHFRFVVPEGFEITEINSPLLSRWDVKVENGRKIANVRLREPTTETVALSIAAVRVPPRLGDWQFPQWEPLDVEGHVAVLGVSAEQPLKAEALQAGGLIPIDTAVLTLALPAGADAEDAGAPLRAVAAYYAPQGAFSLSGRFVKPPAELAVTANVLLIVEDGGLHAHGGWAIFPNVEKRFSFDFALPAGWQIAAVTQRDYKPLAYECYGVAGQARRVRVRFPQGIPAGQEFRAYFHAVQTPPGWLGDWKTRELKFPVFSVLGATHDDGALVVAARDDLTVRPEKIERLVPLDETEMRKYDLEGIVPSLAYRYESPPYAAALVVQRTAPRLTARTVSCFRVTPEGLLAHDELAYHVAEARVRRVALELPRDTPETLKIFGLGGTRLKESLCEPAKPGDTVRRWNVLLEEATSGEVRLAVEFKQPLPWKEGKVGDYPLPVVQAAGVAYQSGLVSVEGSAELDVQVHADARRIDVGELTKEAEYRPERHLRGVFSLVGAKKPVTIDVDRRRGFPLYAAVAQRAHLLTLLAADGASQTEARFTLRTKALYLEVKLPQDAELWSAQLLGPNGTADGAVPLKPQRQGDSLLVGLPARAAAGPCHLQLIYASPPAAPAAMRSTRRLPALGLLLRADRGAKAVEVPLADLVWTVRLPSGYEATWAGGTLVADNMPRPLPAAVRVVSALGLLGGGVNPFYGAGESGPAGIARGVNKAAASAGRGAAQQPAPNPQEQAAGQEALFATDLQKRTPGELKLLDALRSPTQLEFVDTPLTMVVDLLKDRHHIDIQLDKKAMEDAGIGTDTPVTEVVKGVSLRSALRLMLHKLGLTYLIQNEVLLITTPEAAESRLATRVYPVADIVGAGRDEDDNAMTDWDSLTEIIESTVGPTTWDSVGGPGSIAHQAMGNAKVLVLSQTQPVHEEVVGLLQGLRKVKAAAAEGRDATAVVGVSETTPAEQNILRALSSPTEIQCKDTPLVDLIDHLKKYHKIEIQLDTKAMEDAGIAADTPVTKSLKGMNLEAALRLLLHELNMTYVVENDVLLLTTNEAAESKLATRIYPVGDILDRYRDENGNVYADFDSLIDGIRSTVAPQTWDEVGGPGSIAKITMGTADALVISQTQEVHDEIVDLLGRLREAKRQSDLQTGGRKELPLRRAPGFVGGFGGMGGMGGFGGGMGGNAGGGMGANNAPVPGQQPVTPNVPQTQPGAQPQAGNLPAVISVVPVPDKTAGPHHGHKAPKKQKHIVQEEESDKLAKPVAPGEPEKKAEKGAEKPFAATNYKAVGGTNFESLTAARKERFGTKDMKVRAAAAKRIDAALHSPTQLEFVDCPLSDVIDYLKDYHQIEIRFDKKALDEAGISLSAPVTKSLKGVSLNSALRLVLHDLGLTHVVADDALLITTPAEAERKGETRVYEVADLVVPAWGKGVQSRTGLEGASSLKIELQEPAAPAGQTLTFHSLGAEPELVLTLADRARFDALAWGLALAVGLIGLAKTNCPLRKKVAFIFAVALIATLLPLACDGLEIARASNMVFYAASLLVPYYLLVGLVKWLVRGMCPGCCCRATSSAAAVAAVLLALVAGHASAQTGQPKGEPLFLPAPTAAEEKIETALKSPTQIEFVDMPLGDVVDYLKDFHQIDIRLDKKAMDAAGIAADVTVTKNLNKIPLRSALRLMLHELGLAYVIQDGALVITSKGAAEKTLLTRTYPVADLVAAAGGGPPDLEPLIDAIRTTIQPATWEAVGGPGTLAAQSTGNAPALVCTQTRDVHEEVAGLLIALREVKAAASGPDARRPVDVPKRTPAEEKIERALKSPTQLEFLDTPLTDVIDCLKDIHKIEIQIDKKAMDEAGVGDDSPVTKNAKGITLKAALRLMLPELGLTCVIQDGVLLITTTEAAESMLATRIYPLTDIVATHRDEKGKDVADVDALIDVIHSTVAPTTWDEAGGPGSVTHLTIGGAPVLVVSQTQAVHEQIAALLDRLYEAKQPAAGKDKDSPLYVFKPTPAEEKILAALDAPAEGTFKETPLRDVINSLAKQYKIEIQLDCLAAEGAGIGADSPMTQDRQGITLRAALKAMLPPVGLTYSIENDVLLITTKEAAENKLATRLYPVTDLAEPWRDAKGKLWGDCTALVEKIKSTIQEQSWDDVGGPGTAAQYTMGNVEVLVISQTQEVHEEIAALLAKLHKAKPSGGQPLPLKVKPASPVPGGSPVPVVGRAKRAPSVWLAIGLMGLAAGMRRRRKKMAFPPCPPCLRGGLLAVFLVALFAGNASAQTGQQKSEPLYLSAPTAAEQKIEAALNSPTELKFTNAPLTAVVNSLKSRHKIDIRFDEKAFSDVGGTAGEVRVTADLRGVALRSALRLTLPSIGLTYIVDDGALVITTPVAAENHLTTVTYPVSDLVERARDANSKVQPDVEVLKDLVWAEIMPTTWEEVGGPGTIKEQLSDKRTVLVVVQTQDAHAEIAALLGRLREVRKSAAEGKDRHEPLPLFGPSAAEEKIMAALNLPAEMNFSGIPLTDLVAHLKDLYKIEIQFDKAAMDGARIVPSELRLTKALKGTSLRSALRQVLHDFNLTYLVENDVLLITTTEAAENSVATRIYPVTDILSADGGEDVESLMDLISASVAPTTWDGSGPPPLSRISVGKEMVLVFAQTQEVHEEVAALLDGLREAKAAAKGRDATAAVNVPKRTPAERRIEAALNEATEFDIKDTPLTGVVDYLKKRHKIEIQLDRKAMEDASIRPGVLVTRSVKGISLRSALRPLLDGLGLTFVIENEVLSITTKEAAENKLTTRIYPVTDLTEAWRDADGKLWGDCTSLATKVSSRAQPQTREGSSGPGSIIKYEMGNTAVLIISQTQEVHEEIAALLAKLHKAIPSGQQPLPLKHKPSQPPSSPGGGMFWSGALGGGRVPEGRQSIARGVSPWDKGQTTVISPDRGDTNGELSDTVAPRGAHARSAIRFQGLTPLAIDYRRSAARHCPWVFLLAIGLVGLAAGMRRRRKKMAFPPCPPCLRGAFFAVFLMALFAGNASAQTGADNENARDAGPPVVVPDDAIIRPYDPQPDGGLYGDRLLVPYARYVELWNRAHPDKKLTALPAPMPYALAGASYHTTLEGDDFLLLSGRLNIDVYADGFVQIPLGLRGGVLARADLDGKAARLRLAGFQTRAEERDEAEDDTEDNTPVVKGKFSPPDENPFAPRRTRNRSAATRLPSDALVVLYAEGKGRHVLDVEVRVRLTRQGGWRVAEAMLPAAPASTLAVKVPGGETEVRLSQVPDRRSYDTDKDGQTIQTVLGAAGELALQWRPKVAEGQVDRGLTGQSAAVVDVQEDGLRAVWDVALEFRRNTREQFQFSVPKDYLVEKVAGSNVRGWEIRKGGPAGKEQTVEVTLLKAAKDHEQIALHLWRGGAVGQGGLTEFDVPLVQPSGAAQAAGQVTIRRSPLLDVRTVQHAGVTRIDLADAAGGRPADGESSGHDAGDESPLGIHPYQAYRFATMPFTLRLRAEPMAARTTAEVQTLLKFTEYRPTLECRAVVHVQDRPIYRVEMLLPEDLKIRQVSAPGEFQWARTERDKRRLLTVYFTAGQSGDVPVVVQGTLGGAGKIESLPLPGIEVCGVDDQAGDIAVQADPAFDVEDKPLQGCQETELDQVAAWLNPQQRQLTRLALHYRRPGYSGTLRLAARKPDVTCDTMSKVCVTDRVVEESIVLTFTVQRAGVRELRFQIPATMADARISVPMLRRKTVAPQSDEPGAPLEVRVELQEERMDQIRVRVENDRLLEPENYYDVPIPVVETGRTNRQYAALQKAGRDELQVTMSPGLERISPQQQQWHEVEAVLGRGITEAYAVNGEAPKLKFHAVPHKDVEVPGARIGLAYTTLVLDANGAYRAATAFLMDNATEQFLQVDLPAGAALWSAVVAGEPVKPVEDPAATVGRVAIPLVKTAAGERDYAVVLIYGGKMPPLGRLSSVAFPLLHTANINVERSVVQLRLPETHCWFNFGGTAERAEADEVAARVLSYQAKEIERLTGILLQSDPFAQARAQKALDAALQQVVRGSNNRAAVNGPHSLLETELQKTADVVARARKALGQEETQWRQHGEGEVDLPVIESLKSGKSNRAHDVVKGLGENWTENAQPAAQQPPTQGQFNPKWFKGKGFSTPGGGRQGGMNGQGGFNGGQGGVNGMRGFGGGQGMGGMGGGAGFFNIEPEDNPFATDSPAPASAGGASPQQPSAQLAGLASLDFQLPQHGQLYYFLTPRGDITITAQAASSDLLVKLGCLLLAVIAIVVISAGLRAAFRGNLAWLVGPRANTLMACLGTLAIVTGILPIAGGVLLVVGLALPIRRTMRRRAASTTPAPATAK